MNLEELKLLTDAELQETHQKAVGFMQDLAKDGNKPNKEDFLKNIKLVVDAGQILRERGIIIDEPKIPETEEEKKERKAKFRRESRNEDIGYIGKGILLLLLGFLLSAITNGRYLFYGAILMGIGFIGIGIYGRMKSE